MGTCACERQNLYQAGRGSVTLVEQVASATINLNFTGIVSPIDRIAGMAG
jgi:hypothetical protein